MVFCVRQVSPRSSKAALGTDVRRGAVEQGPWISRDCSNSHAGLTVDTPAVQKFRRNGEQRLSWQCRCNRRRREAVSNCIICHGADGTGKMGPTLVGKDVVYKQVLTDPGMFSIIYGGASGAMQSFHRRGMKQDEMLRIVAYVRTLEK